jgi:hypothetical protein
MRQINPNIKHTGGFYRNDLISFEGTTYKVLRLDRNGVVLGDIDREVSTMPADWLRKYGLEPRW